MTLSFGRLGQISASGNGLYVMWRLRHEAPYPVPRFTRGFIIKPKRRKLFSERNGMRKGVDVGPLYARLID